MYFIGFDIGGTKCAVSLGKVFDGVTELAGREETPTLDDPIKTLEALAPVVEKWTREHEVKRAGISCGGPLDSQKGIIISTPNLSSGWHGFSVCEYVKSRFGLESKLENDANASALAEWQFGAGRGYKNLVFMTFGTGLGAGLILDGRLYSGTNGNAGEIGHVRLEKSGPVGYNKAGSAEGFCSGGGIKRLAVIRASEKGIAIDPDITTKIIFEKARQGDGFFLSVVKESAEKFARVISLLIDLFNPEVIVAGGVFMRNYDLFMESMTPVIEAESLGDSYKVCRILPAEIGENIGDYAALAIAVTEEQ